jgi:signal peptidase I
VARDTETPDAGTTEREEPDRGAVGSRVAGTPAAATSARRGSSVLAVLRETALIVALSLAIATVVRIFLVQAFLIPSQSMEDTLLVQDRVLVSKLVTRLGRVERGDVVVFEDPGGWLGPTEASTATGWQTTLRDGLEFVGVLPSDTEGHLIKRVIAVGGDTVACCDGQGRLTVNGASVEEGAYLFPSDEASADEFSKKVPANSLWVMGDHRSNSGDSRVHGAVPVDKVVGRAFAVVWPLSRFEVLSRPAAFDGVGAASSP